MKLYLINCYEGVMASEQIIDAMRTLPTDTIHYKYELLEESDVILPEGFTIEETVTSGTEIFFGDDVAVMLTEYVDGRYVTSLVTSKGITTLHKWTYSK